MLTVVKLVSQLHVGGVQFAATLFGELLFAELRFFGDCFLVECGLLCLASVVSFLPGFVTRIMSDLRLAFGFTGLPGGRNDSGDQNRERGGSQTKHHSKPCTLNFGCS